MMHSSIYALKISKLLGFGQADPTARGYLLLFSPATIGTSPMASFMRPDMVHYMSS